ncbi:NAD-dependent epimerase/dehydratase family protein [Sphingobacterium endophyticum]|uniref:NAD-dependent epimerase/dehydratase family protein n=1 Tax=Sphingobacterium endophyticum TaxID=2546448 RepID=UPI0012E1CDF4|nr:NAD-dependent epimerase/dehydratase family protein [Sphingobacterium endophyticum]
MHKIKVIITGATGMVGEGVLQECLNNSEVEKVLIVTRKEYPITHPKLKQMIFSDILNIDQLGDELVDYNACFFCAGVSSVGMNEDKYTKLTYDLTLNFSKKLLEINKDIVFCYVSGSGTDSSEKGKVMWARVKGKTENDLLKLPFKAVYNFRPGFMRPSPGAKNVKGVLKFISALYPILRPLNKTYFLTLEEVGKAMVAVSRNGYNKHILETQDISFLASQS